MKNWMKKNVFYIFLFLIVLLFNLLVSRLNLDEVWSYGFSYNLYHGLIPYKDFNMVITPFYPFFMSLPMYLLGDSIFVFHLMNALLVVILFKILFSCLSHKAWILIPFFIFPLNVTFPNYNFFLLLLFFILILMEEKKSSDYWIGILLAITFLTKQSVGIPLLLGSLYYLPDWKKIGKRFIGFFLPVLFVVFLFVIQGSFSSFMDLCFYGLLDFGSGNGSITTLFFYLMFPLLGLFVYFYFTKKKISYLYILLFASICVPLFDLYHFQLFCIACLGIFLFNSTLSFKRAPLVGIGLGIGFLLVYTFHVSWNGPYPNDISHFQYRYLSKKQIQQTKNTIALIKKYHHKVIFIGPNGYYYKIILDEKINYLDLINTGNFGYHGSDKLFKKIKNLDKDYVFFVSMDELGLGKQTDQKLISYIVKNGKKIEEASSYSIYRLEE